MKNILTIVAAVLLLSACSTTPYEQVYINDHGNYYIAETESSHGYYVYEPVIMRYYGFSPWWYDNWYYSPYYAWYGYGWPYDYLDWYYRPWYAHGYGHAYAQSGIWGPGGLYWRPVYVSRPAVSSLPDVTPDENGRLPSPIRPVAMRPGMESSLDASSRRRELMQRGQTAYRSDWRERPLPKDIYLRQSGAGKPTLSQKPIKIDSRKLPQSRHAALREYDSGMRSSSRAAFPSMSSPRAGVPVSRGSVRISRNRIDRD